MHHCCTDFENDTANTVPVGHLVHTDETENATASKDASIESV